MASTDSELKLNKEQIEAIKFANGPLLIIAGAGTGKTTVITERIKYLILGKRAKPSEILALTFTEKAAREMQERVDIAMPYGYTDMWISTFHSFCDRVLRAEALHIGLDPRYKLMSEAEAVQLIRNNLFNLPAQAGFDLDYFRPLGNPTKFVGGMLQHFSRLQDEDVSPKDYVEWVKKQKTRLHKSRLRALESVGEAKDEKLEISKWEELAGAYKAYEELKTKEALMDFGDLIVKTLKLFRERPNILKNYREQFKYILIDEFQDTNFAQNELALLLAGGGPPSSKTSARQSNITVVGDDDQSIYRFRGAAVSNIVQFRKSFPKTKIVTLTKNYRSTQEILDKAYQLIQFNNPDRLEAIEKIDKKLVATRADKGADVSFIHVDRVENEAEAVAKKIRELTNQVTKQPINYKDFAILVRANNHAEPFTRALSRHGVPYQFLGPGRLFKQAEIIDLISYLKVLNNFEDSVSFYRLLSLDYFEITPRDLAGIGNFARRYNLTLFEACDPPSHKASDGQEKLWFVSEDTRKKIGKIVEIINKHLKLVRRETAGQLLYYFLQDTGLLTKLLSPESVEAEKKAANISKFFDKLKTYEVDHEDATIPAVVDWIELSKELGESPLAADTDWTEINAVNILTAHSAKGLEFPVVFLVNLVSQRFPTIERREQIPIPEALIKEVLPIGDYHLEEERRLFYVGMTRARDFLFLTAADYYGEGKREKRLSPFIFEALGKQLDSQTSSQLDSSKQLSFLDYSAPDVQDAQMPSRPAEFHIDYLSYSQIETFKTCPLHYKLKYIYKVPTPPSASLSFGSSMHAALKNFFDLVAAGKKPSPKLIHECLETNWVKEGYTSKVHEKKFYQKGKLYLSGFLKVGFNPKNLPVAMEQPFTLPLNQESGIRNQGKSLKIGGKIDRVDVLPDGTIEIIDYKTGATIPKQYEVDKNLQLSFYALAATQIPTAPFASGPEGPMARRGKMPEKVKLSLYFLDNQEKLSTVRTKEDLEKAIHEILAVRDEIEKSEFRCSNHMFCQSNCEYSLFCKAD